MAQRTMIALHRSQPTSDGAGVRLSRALGTSAIPDLDPFLMLDEFFSDDPNDYIAGFPDHPHRGSRPSPTCSRADGAPRQPSGTPGASAPGTSSG